MESKQLHWKSNAYTLIWWNWWLAILLMQGFLLLNLVLSMSSLWNWGSICTSKKWSEKYILNRIVGSKKITIFFNGRYLLSERYKERLIVYINWTDIRYCKEIVMHHKYFSTEIHTLVLNCYFRLVLLELLQSICILPVQIWQRKLWRWTWRFLIEAQQNIGISSCWNTFVDPKVI